MAPPARTIPAVAMHLPHVFVRIVRIASLSCTTGLLAPVVVGAQSSEVRGVVRDSASGRPIAGVVVMSLDAVGQTLHRTLTNERGQYRLSRSPNSLLLRAVRLGYRPQLERLPPFVPDANGAFLALDLTLATVPRTLESLEVSATRGCPARSDRPEAYALLDQARAGLLAMVVARERQPAMLHVLRYERFLDLDGIETERQVVHRDSSVNAVTSFNAVHSAYDFVERGFRAGRAGEYTFFGPDAEVLLDERFQRGYCFSVAVSDSTRAGQVGLRFTPATRRDGRVDIDGTLWIDTTARSLRDIQFRYLGVEPLAEAFGAGGRISFRALPSGVTFIDAWSLRLLGAPTVEPSRGVSGAALYAIREIGGELVSAQWTDGDRWQAPLGALHLTAVRRNGEPAANVILRLLGSDYRTTTDSAGRASFMDLLPGPYTLAADDARLETIDIQIPIGRTLSIRRNSASVLRIEVPTLTEFVGTLCDRRDLEPDEAWVVGRIMTADGHPAPGARYRVSEANGLRWRVLADNGFSTLGGVFRQCRTLRRNTLVEVAAWRDPREAVQVRQVLETPVTVVRIALPGQTVAAEPQRETSDRARRTTGATTDDESVIASGTVRDSASGAPVADARVTILGTPFEGATDSTGAFVIGGFARGAYTVEVSAPWLDSIGVVQRVNVMFTAAHNALSLALPSIPGIMTQTCGSPTVPGALVGRVRSATAAPLPPGLLVEAMWGVADDGATTDSTRRVVAEPGASGTYRLCGVPTDVPLHLRIVSARSADGDGAPPARHHALVSASRRFARMDLVFDPSAPAAPPGKPRTGAP